ncbi:MAG TPA: hypothetical protein VNI01_12445 [Elusimicrobiota bacterium]|jgi:hypothetical protein|nr:hypothetical protein [Elusimicrobiota bacterium]
MDPEFPFCLAPELELLVWVFAFPGGPYDLMNALDAQSEAERAQVEVLFATCDSCDGFVNVPSEICECGSAVCDNCVVSCSIRDWLDICLLCSVCGDAVCPDCVRVCFDCARQGDDYPVHCEVCAPEGFDDVGCDQHTWFTCGSHVRRCGEPHSPSRVPWGGSFSDEPRPTATAVWQATGLI